MGKVISRCIVRRRVYKKRNKALDPEYTVMMTYVFF